MSFTQITEIQNLSNMYEIVNKLNEIVRTLNEVTAKLNEIQRIK